MTLSTFSDLAQLQNLRRDSSQLKADLSRLTSELSSGKVADVSQALRGDFSTLSDVTRNLRLNQTFRNSIAEAATAAETRQAGLERLSNEIDGFAPRLLSLASGGSLSDIQTQLADASGRFDAAVNSLNTRLAGRSIFSADRPDQNALISSETIMTELRTLVAGATDAATITADVTAWFEDAGGGYETIAWQGGDGPVPSVLVGEGKTAETGVSALEPAIRQTLAGLALAALAEEQVVPLPEAEQRALATSAANGLLEAETNIVSLRARLGTEEARIEEARVAAEAARTSLQLQYNRIVEADPYDTATELEATSNRLESLYIVTARVSRLSLTEFLR
ncbi:flagellin [Gymnodinialimonas sp. 2305UL16-5]|uniref:flagellin n=1 Tax=Gymnodinialimonas mytili TaxID=3126503 RepID=UPI00309670C5